MSKIRNTGIANDRCFSVHYVVTVLVRASCPYFYYPSAGIDFRRQTMASTDVRF